MASAGVFRRWAALALAFACAACSTSAPPDDGGDTRDTDECSDSYCWEQCSAAGHRGGLCDEGDDCVCFWDYDARAETTSEGDGAADRGNRDEGEAEEEGARDDIVEDGPDGGE